MRRFLAEARMLKDSGSSVESMSCGAKPMLDNRGSSGPSKLEIDETLQRWAERLTAGGSAARDALLRSMAFNIAFTAMTRSKAGRDVLRVAAQGRGQGQGAQHPLGVI